jgi:pSer/pThr/pTyr-binding forkhead associated (FHA) protein
MFAICGACQAANSPKSRFCQKCGTALSGPTEAAETTLPDGAPPQDVTAEFDPNAPSPSPHREPSPPFNPVVQPPVPPKNIVPPPLAVAKEPPSVLSDPLASTSTDPLPEPDPTPPVISIPDLDDQPCPIELGINFDRILVAENPSTFEILLESRCEMPLENVEVLFESARALGSSVRFGFKRIPPGAQFRRRIEIEPLRAGNFVLQCSVMLDTRAEKKSYIGSRALRVNAIPDTSNISINVSDILNNTDSGANAGLGKELRDNKVTTNIDMSRIRTLNDLLDLELPENFQPLDLQLDYQLSIASINVARDGLTKTLSIPGPLVGTCQAGMELRLIPTDQSSSVLTLVARPRFTFGRSRQQADFVAWFWPRSNDNDAKTKRISGQQAIAEVQNDQVVVRDGNSANGTTYNGAALDATLSLALDRRGTLAFASEYQLDCLHVPSRMEKGSPSVSNIRLWGGPGEIERPWLGAVRFQPLNSEVTPYDALWLLSDAEFGRSHSNPIITPDESLAEIQGRILHWRGCFWLENGVDNQAVSLNHLTLKAGEIAPLASGQHLQLGRAAYRLEVAGG